MATTTSDLAKGKRVILHGLNTTALNGKKGEIIKLVEDRWAVRVDGEDKTLKTIKPENLKLQETVSVVVIPPHRGSIYYTDLPATDLQQWSDATKALLEDTRCNNYYHYYWLPGGVVGWMTMTMNDLFQKEQHLNVNLQELGWSGPNEIYGTVVISFGTDSRESPLYFFDSYSMDIVEKLLRELVEARTMGHPTRERIAVGEYMHLPAMPSVKCHQEE
jgi:hypothetical protein